MAINTHFLPQAVAALSLGLAEPCLGATIALRRDTLDRIGGFLPFADALADDHAIGAAIRAAGCGVAVPGFTVGHVCFEDRARQYIRRHLRAARTIRSLSPLGYAGTILTHPVPLALLGALQGSTGALAVVAAALASRLVLCRVVERRFGLPRQSWWLVPLQDAIALAVYVLSFCGSNVHWRGAKFQVADGKLVDNR
jgi:ceramide glucosyltransferase